MIHVCRCCNTEIERARVEVLVSIERPRPGMHASGRTAAVACKDCAPSVSDGILQLARLWTPDQCTHVTRSLFT